MNHIQKLTAELCPQGVPYIALGEVAELKRGRVIPKTYLEEQQGQYPVYSSQTTNNGEIGKINTYDFDGEFVTWTTDGAHAGTVFYRNEKFSITNICGLIIINSKNEFSYKFIYYWLSIEAKKHVYAGMGNPKLMSNQVAKILIPLPPLQVQKEIVNILDKFTELQKELQKQLKHELSLRQKQYAYYREQLLTFGDEVPFVALGEVGVGKFTRGGALQKKDFIDSGVGCIHYGQIYTHYGTYAYQTKTFVSEEFAKKARKAKTGDLIIATTSENDKDLCKAVVWLGDKDIVISSDACFYTHTMNPKYVAYFFQSEEFQQQKRAFITGTKVRRVNADDLAKILIPLPPLHEQQRIVDILDKFDTLCTSLTQGLPKEIELRQKQYEYYRDLLLTF